MLFKVICKNRAALPLSVCRRFGVEQYPTQANVPSAFKRVHSVQYQLPIDTIGELVELAEEVGDAMILSGDGMVITIGPETAPVKCNRTVDEEAGDGDVCNDVHD